jgi:pyrimidine operon attenuation protein / uracil phosphoribosyltransferase
VAEHRRGDPAGASTPARELLGAADVARTIARIAHQIIEKTATGADGMPTSC